CSCASPCVILRSGHADDRDLHSFPTRRSSDLFKNVRARTSGQSDEPPIPISKTSAKPASSMSFRRAWYAEVSAASSAPTVSQPSHLASSSSVQTEASFCQIRLTLLSAFQPAIFSRTRSSISGGSEYEIELIDIS